MKPPSVKSVMKALRSRIVARVTSSLPEIPESNKPLPDSSAIDAQTPQTAQASLAAQTVFAFAVPTMTNTATEDSAYISLQEGLSPSDLTAASDSPYAAKVCRQLIENLGAERAVEALIALHYGELLDPSRYAPLTEFAELPAHETGRREQGRHAGGRADTYERRRRGRGFHEPSLHRAGSQETENRSGTSRVYVGLGRRHGATARDVAGLLSRAGDIPGRLVDAIEMKDYCAFASLPAEAARRACSFSRNMPEETTIRPADEKRR
jgi:ATP-dependent RNA helicase DeaD